MSGQDEDNTPFEDELLLTHLIARHGELHSQIQGAHATYAEEVRPAELKRAVYIQPREAELKAVVARIDRAVERVNKRDGIKTSSRTLEFASGSVTLGVSGTALEITDEKEFMRLARLWRFVTRVSVLKERVINKNMIKAFLKNYPRFYPKVAHLLVQPRKKTLVVRSMNYQVEETHLISEETVPYPPPRLAVEPVTPSS